MRDLPYWEYFSQILDRLLPKTGGTHSCHAHRIILPFLSLRLSGSVVGLCHGHGLRSVQGDRAAAPPRAQRYSPRATTFAHTTQLRMAAAAVRISLTPCWSLLYLFAADDKHYMELGKLVVLLEAAWLAPWAQIYFIMQWEFNGAAAHRREGTGCFTYRLVPQWRWLTGAVIPSLAFLQPATNIEHFHPSTVQTKSTQNHSIPETRVGLIPSISLSNQMGLKDPCITISFSSFLTLRSMDDL